MASEDKKWDLMALKKSIPTNLYQSNTATSLYYAGRSIVLVAAILTGYLYALQVSENIVYKTIISLIYWFFQGTVFWGIFTIGHDCGHRSFSSHQWVNDLVGTIYHGFILVPYYPWKMSHQHHHKNTGNIDKDEIFYPIREHDAKRMTWKGLTFMHNGFLLGLGWVTYLFGGFPGINYTRTWAPELVKGVNTKSDEILKVQSAFHSHFNPYDPMWANNLFLSTTSVAFVAAMVYATTVAAGIFGWSTVVACYYVPWFVFCSYLTIVTFLHHASEKTRWLDGSIWNYARGQLENTIDRTYGPLVDNLSHNIGTHVVHHLFPIIPHYNLVEANKALKAFTQEKGLPHHDVVDRVSGLTEFAANAKRYSKNFIVPEDALITSLGKGVEVKMGTPEAEKEIAAWKEDESKPSVQDKEKEKEKKTTTPAAPAAAPVVAAATEEKEEEEEKAPAADAAADESSTEDDEEEGDASEAAGPVSAPRKRKL